MSLKSTFLGKMGTELKYKITNDNQSRSQVKLDIKPNTCFLLPWYIYLQVVPRCCCSASTPCWFAILFISFCYFFQGCMGKCSHYMQTKVLLKQFATKLICD